MDEMDNLASDFINRRIWAVVGVSTDPEKYGHKVYAKLLEAGYEVFGVNPKGGELFGRPIYQALSVLPVPPEVVDIVTPPVVTESIVKQCAELGLSRVWMQPGAESEAAIAFCHEHGIAVVYNQCAMVRRRIWA